MQSRRKEEYGTRSSMAARLKDPMDRNPYLMPGREVMGRPPRHQRSLSPPGREADGGSFEEGRDLGRQVDGRNIRAEREYLRSQSPPVGRMYERRHNYDERIPSRDELRRKYEFYDTVDYKDESDRGFRYGSFRGNVVQERVLQNASDQRLSGQSRVSGNMYSEEYRSQSELEYLSRHAEGAGKCSLSSRNLENARFKDESMYPKGYRSLSELEYNSGRAEDAGRSSLSSRNLENARFKDENMHREEYRSQSGLEYISGRAEDAGRSSLLSRNLENARSKDESVGYPDPFLLGKLLALETYKEGEEYTIHSRDASYSRGSASLSKNKSQLKEFSGTSSRSLRENMIGIYNDDMSLPVEVHPSGPAQPVEQYSFAEVWQRHSSSTRRDSGANHDDMLRYKRVAFSPPVVKGREQDYLSSKNGFQENDSYNYPLEEMHGRRLHLDDMDCYQRDVITSSVIEPNRQHAIHGDSQRGLMSRNSLPVEVHPSGSAQLVEQYSFAEVRQGHSSSTPRDSKANHDDMQHYKRVAFSPPVVEGREQDFLYSKNGFQGTDSYKYPSEELHGRRIHLDDMDSYQRDVMTSGVIEPNRQHMIHGNSQRDLMSSNSWGTPSSQDQLVSKYLFTNSSFGSVDEPVRLCLEPENTNLGFDRRILRDRKVSMLNISPHDGLSRVRTTRNPDRDAIPVSGTESIRISSDNQYQMGMQDLRRKIIFMDELDSYDPPRRSLKRKYIIDEELSRHKTGDALDNTFSMNNSIYETQRDEEQNDLDAGDFLPFKSLEYNRYNHRGAGRKVELVNYSGGEVSDDRWLYADPVDHPQEYSGKPSRPGERSLKGLPRDLDSDNSKTSNKRYSLTRNVCLRGKDIKELDESAYETLESKNRVSSSGPSPPEESKEFKELVQGFFLSFSKMLNENLGTQKRYKGQGQTGSLFCIICRKSMSKWKEFKDTKGLATHCYMLKKVELRAQHLGLHKAICVLRGWNTAVGANVVTFYPQAISISEALAQKEDLILWPPVVIIHSISVSDGLPRGQKVFTEEAVENFLRGKGFSVGKIKVCQGVSANMMVVKFLGTFSQLRDAEKLHKYFLDDKNGRMDFEQMSPDEGKDKKKMEERTKAGKLEEHDLYGYLAISEDLGKVDSDTKRKCSVRSKKEIEDFEEQPLK